MYYNCRQWAYDVLGTVSFQYDKNSASTVSLKDMDITWGKAKELATDRAAWRQRVVAQCNYMDAGWTKV